MRPFFTSMKHQSDVVFPPSRRSSVIRGADQLRSGVRRAIAAPLALLVMVAVTPLLPAAAAGYGDNVDGCQIIEAYSLWDLQHDPGSRTNCSGLDLQGANFSGRFLPLINFSGANLRGADLTGAVLIGADFTGADLTGATLTDTYLAGVRMVGATLTEVIAGGASRLEHRCSFERQDCDTLSFDFHFIGGAMLLPDGWLFEKGYLVGPRANLREADLRGARLQSASLANTHLEGADLREADLGSPGFDGDFRIPGADLRSAYLSGAQMQGARLTKADLSDADLWRADLTGAVLPYADLKRATLTDTNLTGAVGMSSAILDQVRSGGVAGAPGVTADWPSALPEGWILTVGHLIGPSADLTGADLAGADLTGVNIGEFTYDPSLSTRRLVPRATMTGVRSGGVVGAPVNLDRWRLVDGYLIGPEADLRSADLDDADMQGADLQHADLTGASLARADLRGADLTEATLVDTDLTEARMGQGLRNGYITPVSLFSADLSGADLSDADLSDADLSGAVATGTRFVRTNLTGALIRIALDAAILIDVTSGEHQFGPLSLPSGWSFVENTTPTYNPTEWCGDADDIAAGLCQQQPWNGYLDGAPAFTDIPGDVVVEAVDRFGAPASWTAPTATDARDGAILSTCTPGAGTTFALGTTTVRCEATDNARNVASTTFTVTVRDSTPPSVSGPDKVTLGTDTGLSTRYVATYDFGFTSTDSVNAGPFRPDCTPAAPRAFALGSTTINCSVTDAAGNAADYSFSLVVEDREAPAWHPPAGLAATLTVQTAPGKATAEVAYPGDGDWAADNVGVVSSICTRSSGSTFEVGTTTVTCTAADAAGNTSSTSFDVTVIDAEPPTVVAPDVEPVEATGPSGAGVSWDPPTTADNVGVVSSSCSPTSGSTFAVGTTTVTCSATDAAGNTGSNTFTVTVRDTIAPALAVLKAVAAADGLYPGETSRSFPATVGSALVTLSGTTSDLVGVRTVSVNGIDATLNGDDWSLEAIALAADEPTELTIVAADAAGNTATAVVEVTFDTDLDADGIANNVDGTCEGTTFFNSGGNLSFSDLELGGATCGIIVDDGGHQLSITDSAALADGVHVEVGGEPGSPAQIRIAGKASMIFLAPGTVADITDPATTTTVHVTTGEASVELAVAGVPVVINIPAGATATITETANVDGTVYDLEIITDGGSGVTVNGEDASDGVSFLAPTDKDQCKQDGWRDFNFPRPFENLGRCIRFVNTGD